jgi:hypothetical protein
MSISRQLRKLISRRNAWRDITRNEKGELTQSAIEALAHLRRFCYMDRGSIKVSQKSGQIDPYAMALIEGRREVFMLIEQHIKLDDSDLQRLIKQHSNEVYDDE